ncbi:hypothetical protein M9435_003842 [Picochlorum sp. BPE23]|nr:hypothetical protein M9435_003842 [Picochlorum sp. BPE23]
MLKSWWLYLGVSAGCLGATSAALGKCAGLYFEDRWGLRIFLYILMVLANGGMLFLFSASMRHTSSLRATGVSVGSNIIMSGILGAVFFGEAVSMPWVIGIVLIVGAAALCANGASNPGEVPVQVSAWDAQGSSGGARGCTHRLWSTCATTRMISMYRHVPKNPAELDIDAMREGCQSFVGLRDFRLLTNKTDRALESSERLIYQCKLGDIPGGIRVAVMGKGFLYKQVRNMVGVLIAVGYHKLDRDDISILLQGDETKLYNQKSQYQVAEGKGLCLQRVFLLDEQLPDSLFPV